LGFRVDHLLVCSEYPLAQARSQLHTSHHKAHRSCPRPHGPRQVDATPLPCDTLAALATEVTNPLQAGCTINPDTSISHALVGSGRAHFLQLLVAAGLLPAVDKTSTAFTVFAPSDAAIEAAADRGTVKYSELFAKNRTLLAQIVGYHIGKYKALTQPSVESAVAVVPNLMKGDAGCGAGVGPAWGADGLLRGGRGVARVNEVMPGALGRGGLGLRLLSWASFVSASL